MTPNAASAAARIASDGAARVGSISCCGWIAALGGGVAPIAIVSWASAVAVVDSRRCAPLPPPPPLYGASEYKAGSNGIGCCWC
jgi:hypothetical protein